MRDKRMMGSLLASAMMLAAVTEQRSASAWSSVLDNESTPYEPQKKEVKPYPRMITSSDAEIAAHNAACTSRQVLRNKWRTRA